MEDTRTRFGLFLHTGQHSPTYKYVAGSCTVRAKMQSIDELGIDKMVQDVNRTKTIVEMIASAHIDDSPTFTVVYALAAVVASVPKTDTFSDILKDLYTLMPIVLHNNERLMLFNKIASFFKLTKGTVWQRCMKSWYADCNYEILLDCLIGSRSNFGWTHKDIHNLLHCRGLNDAHKLFCKYLYEGLDSALILDNIPDDIVHQLKVIDKLKKTKDSEEVVNIIDNFKFIKYQHVPISWFNAKNKPYQVWKTIIGRLNLNELLPNIVEIYKLKTFDSSGKDFSELLLETNKLVLNSVACPISAFFVYSEVKSAMRLYKPKRYSKKGKKSSTVIVSKGVDLNKTADVSQNKLIKSGIMSHESEINLSIGLLSLVNRSLLAMPQDCNIKCLITLDMREHMFTRSKRFKGKTLATEEVDLTKPEVVPKVEKQKSKPSKCFHSKTITPGDAGVFLAVYLKRSIKDTVVSVYGNPSIKCAFSIEEADGISTSFEKTKEKLMELKCEKVGFNKPFEYALSRKWDIDLFVNVVDSYSRTNENLSRTKKLAKNVHEALKKYKETSKKPKARAVTVSLCCRDVPSIGGLDEDVLHISGFDENVPKIIKKFAFGII